ncbi:hypothetical protein BDL97_01G091600 [Sphagnum fallax]|nr:hypothetical protein BDL97_01G091600 [Sphagnum fallax]
MELRLVKSKVSRHIEECLYSFVFQEVLEHSKAFTAGISREENREQNETMATEKPQRVGRQQPHYVEWLQESRWRISQSIQSVVSTSSLKCVFWHPLFSVRCVPIIVGWGL